MHQRNRRTLFQGKFLTRYWSKEWNYRGFYSESAILGRADYKLVDKFCRFE
jgi:hypothetical protein